MLAFCPQVGGEPVEFNEIQTARHFACSHWPMRASRTPRGVHFYPFLSLPSLKVYAQFWKVINAKPCFRWTCDGEESHWKDIGCWETPVHVISTASSTAYWSWSSCQDPMQVCPLRLGIQARDKFMTAGLFSAVLFKSSWLACEIVWLISGIFGHPASTLQVCCEYYAWLIFSIIIVWRKHVSP